MKKVKYGNRSKSKPENTLESLKDGDDDICGAVLDTLSTDYLKYISDLVKGSQSKTPSKKHPEEKINRFFKEKEIHEQRHKRSPERKATLQSQNDVKNQTTRIKKKQKERQGSKWRAISNTTPATRQMIQNRRMISENPFDRRTTEPAANQRISDTSILLKSSAIISSSSHQPKFVQDIDRYLSALQSSNRQRPHKKRECSSHKKQQILVENVRLKKKIRQYQQKVEDMQESVSEHLDYCKTRDKGNKGKIKDLVKALAQALSKINEQKSQLDTMNRMFKSFGRRAMEYSRYDDDSSVELEEEINQSLARAIRPTRAKSQFKMKHKKNLNSTLRRLEEDNFINL